MNKETTGAETKKPTLKDFMWESSPNIEIKISGLEVGEIIVEGTKEECYRQLINYKLSDGRLLPEVLPV